MQTRLYESGSLRGISSDVEKTRTLPFIISTAKKDRHGTVLNQENWHLNNYRKNPIVSYQHVVNGSLFKDPNPDYIIAKSVQIGIEASGNGKQLIAEAKFETADINPLAEKIFRKLLFGTLSATSVGFVEVGKGKYGTGSEAFGRENETYYYEGQELLEYSIVNIPSNPDAGKRSFRDLPQGSANYAKKILGEALSISKPDRFTAEQILLLFEGIDKGLREKDPEKIRKILRDERIENSRKELRDKLAAEEEKALKEEHLKTEQQRLAAQNWDLTHMRNGWYH